METHNHNLNSLFEQLGIPSSDLQIVEFVVQHRPIADEIPIDEANFWNPSQASFLHSALEQNSDWAQVVDQLDAQLRH